MSRRTFDAWRKQGIAAGQRRLADAVRTLLYRADERLFDRFDFADDAQFLHPALFAFLTDPAPGVGLAQVAYGLLPPARRPERIRLDTDAAGCAFLGSAGVVATGLASSVLEFGRDAGDGGHVCSRGAQPVPFRLRRPLAIPGTRIEVTTEIDPVFRRFMDGATAPTDPLPRDRLCPLLLAVALLRAHCPAVWTEIAGVTRLIVLYEAPAPNSFAALSAHGAIFCNVRGDDSEIGLVEDIAHQGAHVLFNALSSDPASVVAIDPATPISDLSHGAGETRSLYEALHGLFTYTIICRALTAMLESAALSETQAHETLGRLGFTLAKFADDLDLLDLPGAYTLAGRRCYDAFAVERAALGARYGGQADFRYDNQPYVFDYARFVERNGGPVAGKHAAAS